MTVAHMSGIHVVDEGEQSMTAMLMVKIKCSLQAAYLVAVLAEHHCTHQLITAQGSIAALLQIMHTARQTHTTSQTLDLVSGSTAQQPECSNSSPSTACLSDRAAGAMAASVEASAAGMPCGSHAVSEVISLRMLEDEEATAANTVPESASSEEVCRQEQSASPQGATDSPAASSAASAESSSHSMDQFVPQDRISSCDTGVCSNSSSGGRELNQVIAGACDGDEEVSSSFTATGDAQRHDTGSMAKGKEYSAGDDEVSSSSIQSRLLKAARAAKGGSSGEAHAAVIAVLDAGGIAGADAAVAFSAAVPTANFDATAAAAVTMVCWHFGFGMIWLYACHIAVQTCTSLLLRCSNVSFRPHDVPICMLNTIRHQIM